MVRKLVIWGASGHALVIADIIRLRKEYEIIGFLDDIKPERRGINFSGAPILGGREQLDSLKQIGVRYLIFGFGNCKERLRLSSLVCEKGFSLITAVHPKAVIAKDVLIGKGTVVAAGVVVNSGSRIGESVIINTSSSIDHECLIEDGAHIGPGAHLAGRVIVGRAAQIGIGATINPGVKIGAESLVGAGSLVLNDIPEGVIGYGVPARVIRKLAEDE